VVIVCCHDTVLTLLVIAYAYKRGNSITTLLTTDIHLHRGRYDCVFVCCHDTVLTLLAIAYAYKRGNSITAILTADIHFRHDKYDNVIVCFHNTPFLGYSPLLINFAEIKIIVQFKQR